MSNRRNILAAAGAMAMLPQSRADQEERFSLFLHGMVWNRQLPNPLNDWLIRLDVLVSIPIIDSPGWATLGDDFHAPTASQVRIQSAVLRGSQLTLTGSAAESMNPALSAQPVRIEGTLDGTSVHTLTLFIGPALFSGMGLVAKTPPNGGPIPIPFPNAQ